jgi:UDP-N-acetylmuramoyl-tripeptide--D-alanyl-D-alanine ligase
MRGAGQIAWLASFTKPEIGVITNVGPAHLEFLGSLENIARAKAELIEAFPAGGIAVVPDEPLLEPYLTRPDIHIVRVEDGPLPFTTNYTAAHQLRNTRTALAAAGVLGIPGPQGELRVEFSKLREEERPLPGDGLLLNDCYNANPVSMRAALEHFVTRAGSRRRVAVLGDMLELGPAAPGYHREVGELVRELGIEHVIAVGEEARAYGGDWVATAAEAAERLRTDLKPGDAVLVKGSLGVGLAVVAENMSN